MYTVAPLPMKYVLRVFGRRLAGNKIEAPKMVVSKVRSVGGTAQSVETVAYMKPVRSRVRHKPSHTPETHGCLYRKLVIRIHNGVTLNGMQFTRTVPGCVQDRPRSSWGEKEKK